jgi:3-oxoacyl-[acyl-carrier protein] reductase
MTSRLEGKAAIVKGAGSGIGRAIALRFATEGARVVIADLSEATGEETAGSIREGRTEASYPTGQVISPDGGWYT